MSIRYDIGDLVYLDDQEDRKIIGIIIDKLVSGNELVDGIVDVEVHWINGTSFWCLAEGLTIIAKANLACKGT